MRRTTIRSIPAPVAQWIERRFPKPQVAGSIPAGGAKTMKSSARLTPTHLLVEVHGWARLLAPYPREIRVPRDSVTDEVRMTTEDVGRLLGWRVVGTGINRGRAMGWFALSGRSGTRGERAWVWLTPGRDVGGFKVNHGRLRVVAVPADWFS